MNVRLGSHQPKATCLRRVYGKTIMPVKWKKQGSKDFIYDLTTRPLTLRKLQSRYSFIQV